LCVGLEGCHARDHAAGISDNEPAERMNERSSVESAVRAIIVADNAGDVDAAIPCYTEDAVWIPPGAPVLCGHAAIRERYTEIFAQFAPALQIDIDEIVVDGGMATARGRTRGELIPRTAGERVVVDDHFVMLLRKTRDGWRIAWLMWSKYEPLGGKS
jgi:uncharacterized protein (TIGR02246 family)